MTRTADVAPVGPGAPPVVDADAATVAPPGDLVGGASIATPGDVGGGGSGGAPGVGGGAPGTSLRWTSAVWEAVVRAPRDVVALAAVAALAPLDVAVPANGWGPVNARPLLLAVIAVSVVVVVGRYRRSPVHVGALHVALGLWLGAIWASVALSAAPALGAATALRLTMFGLLVLAAHAALTTDADRRLVLRGLAGGTLVAGVVGLIVLLAGHEVAGTEHLVGSIGRVGQHARLTRPWSHPNVAAIAIAVALPTFLVLGRRWQATAATVLVPALVLTLSRGALVALLASALVMLAVRRTSGDIRRLADFAGLALVVAVVSPGWSARITPTTAPADAPARAASLDVPELVTLDARGAEVTVGLTNVGTTTWRATGPDRVELSAQWVGAGQDWQWGEHRWALPRDLAPGESIGMEVTVAPTIPVGTYEVRWRAAGRPPIADGSGATSVGVVAASTIDADDVVPVLLARRGPPLTRAEIWRLAVDEFASAPLLGIGPGELGVAVANEVGATHFPGRHAHSLVLEPLATTGLLGAVPLFVVFAGALRRAGRRAWRTLEPVAVAVLAGLVAVVVHGVVDWFLVYASAAIPIALLVGTAWTLPSGRPLPPVRGESTPASQLSPQPRRPLLR